MLESTFEGPMTSPLRLPLPQHHPLQAPSELRHLQGRGSVHRVITSVGDPAWLVTGHEQVQELLADERLGRSHPEPENAARSGASALFGGPLGNFDTEHDDHARMRALLQPHFAPNRMRALRPRVEALTRRLLDGLAEHGDEPVDLIQALALPLPILVICELLGVPYADRERFRSWTEAAADTRDRVRSEQGLTRLFEYGKQLVAEKRRDPADDVISRLCATEQVGDDEIAVLSMSVLFAGHETTAVQIGIGTLLLLAHPGQWEKLIDDPGLVAGAVEEMLRARGKGGGGIPRYARTDLAIGATSVRAGDLVLLDTGAANHDSTVFAEPDRFDVTRREGGHHLSFGHGSRYCIGAPLARIELQAVFTQLPQRFPTMRVSGPIETLQTRTDTLTGGLVALPVTW
jgi:cytochrome P450